MAHCTRPCNLPTLAMAFGLLALCAVDAHTQSATRDEGVDAGERALVIDAVIATLRESYVVADVARQMGKTLHDRQAAGQYDSFVDGRRFAEALTNDLQAVSHDRHLVVTFVAAVSSGMPSAQLSNVPAKETTSSNDTNACHFVNVGTLVGNVGYVKVDAFGPPARCADVTEAAMRLVAECDALIVDLRDNPGGDLGMVAFLSSYFFGQPVQLDAVYERRRNVTYESWTLPFVPGPRFLHKPVFILMSARTFSAAEAFAYDLRRLKRARVVGEFSGGGAHPSESVEISPRFQITVPIAEYMSPIAHTNWEGQGVEPDILVSERLAVQVAYRAALMEIMPTLISSVQKSAVEHAIETLTQVINRNLGKALTITAIKGRWTKQLCVFADLRQILAKCRRGEN